MKTKKNQQGVALIVALVILLVITILGISSVRLSTQDLMIANNEQQQMFVAQATESARNRVVSFYNVIQWINDETTPETQTRSLSVGKVRSTVTITRGASYNCLGQSGEASSVGVGANRCRIYRFAIDSTLLGTGARQQLLKGEGKEYTVSAGNGL